MAVVFEEEEVLVLDFAVTMRFKRLRKGILGKHIFC